GDDDVVAHDVLGHLAGVLEVDGEGLAALADVDVGHVVLHRIAALDIGRAGGGESRWGKCEECGGDKDFADHGSTSWDWGLGMGNQGLGNNNNYALPDP